jgi:ABC-type uncharacterized transport system involved in gliding motility auxiliary subunit
MLGQIDLILLLGMRVHSPSHKIAVGIWMWNSTECAFQRLPKLTFFASQMLQLLQVMGSSYRSHVQLCCLDQKSLSASSGDCSACQ